MLHGDHHCAHGHGRIVLIHDRHLRLAVRLQPRDAALVQPAADALRQHHRQRHPLRRLVRGVAHHDPLIARAEIFAVNYGLRDIGRLPVQAHLQRQLAVRGKLFHGVAHLRAQPLEYGFHVHAGLGGDLARHQNLCVRRHDLDGRPRAGIALEVLVQQHIRELVAELVRVASPHGLGGHETGLCRSVSVFFVHTFSPHSS